MILCKKKEVRAMGKFILANIPPPTCEESGLELGLAQDAGPLGNLAARQTDRQRASLSGKEGKRYVLQQGNLKRELRSCWDSGGKGSKQKLPALFPDYIRPNLNSTFNKETIQRNLL